MRIASLPQQTPPRAGEAGRAIGHFLGWHLALLIALPFALLGLLALLRARSRRQSLREFTDATFEEEVLRSPLPVLVHFFRAWSIADRVVIGQTERLAVRNKGRIRVGWVDMDRNPGTVARLEPLESPAVVLFRDGRKVYQRGGLFQEEDLQKDLDTVLGGASRPGPWGGA